ncbi:PHP domain-containing protein [Paenibacillus ginsengarvi]|uniref:PHP domain-containing protein n=1 Tax=Paenibacillus ginsengarvi TaxID=400777 RepID=A0A3B0B0L2_9BACL|nr:PHP domain-containing protein [Paenibacillus ginsengarvi]RKN66070.1 PHP domain-containing protein [Paenibacillus ginsengarvi]
MTNQNREHAVTERIEFHVRTAFLEEADTIAIESMIDLAASQGHRAIGIVGENAVRAFPAAEKKAKQAGLLPIFGIRASITDEEGRRFSCTAYAQNETGKKQLFKLVSLSLTAEEGTLSKASVEALRGGLILTGGDAGSELFETVFHRSREEAEALARFYDVLVICPLSAYQREYAGQGLVYSYVELEEAVRSICAIGEKLGIRVIAVGNVDGCSKQSEAPFYTTEQLLQEFAYLGENKAYEVVVTNTNEVADRFEAYELFPAQLQLPAISDGDQRIRSLCYSRAEARYGSPLPDTVHSRLERELLAIVRYRFAAPYLIATQVVKQSLSDGFMVGTRGSVGSCLTAYLLGLSEINPLAPHYVCPSCTYSEWERSETVRSGYDLQDKSCPRCSANMDGDGHDIPCETFLGIHLNKVPDIDLNVAVEYQARAQDLLKEIFGENRVFMAGTSKGGRHLGGIIILPDGREAEELTPLQPTELEGRTGWRQTHFDYRLLEHNVLKLDILRHDHPSLMRLLRELTGVEPASIPTNDPNVLELFRSTAPLGVSEELLRTSVATYGIPEMGTPFVREMLKEALPSTFYDLLQISGLSHGTGVWEGNAQELLRSGACTLQSVIALRDHIMQDLIAHGMESELAFKITESVRKGKGVPDEWAVQMQACGMPDWYVRSCRQIQYLFPKAHAVSYVISAIRSAYFKLYYPQEFYAAYFTVHEEEVDYDVISRGYEAILEKLIDLEQKKQPGESNGRYLERRTWEVALEMTARGFRLKKGQGGLFDVADSKRSIAVPAAITAVKA